MKRRIIAMAALSATPLVVLAACSRNGEGAARPADAQTASAWVQPPHVDAAFRDGGVVVVRGLAGPDARVVLRGANGAAVAVGADATGRFELRAPAATGDIRLTPEVQVGEDAAPSPETLVLIRGGTGPMILIAAGEPTVRLDGRGVLDAVDSDGSAVIVSGRTAGGPPTVLVDGARASVMAGAGGTWRATASGNGPAVIMVGDARFDFPGVGAESDFTPVRAGQGWRLTWPTGPSGRQTTWLPDRAS
ncbi:hypothetical protein [Brevundimonas sp.]|jgi:hypothetical protein|uniref:hypothetical protein n=1 Tax=Brevundimonas sp. TaxID=1871086 RepID=UPI0037C08B87